jgi:hypothetical protein
MFHSASDPSWERSQGWDVLLIINSWNRRCVRETKTSPQQLAHSCHTQQRFPSPPTSFIGTTLVSMTYRKSAYSVYFSSLKIPSSLIVNNIGTQCICV